MSVGDESTSGILCLVHLFTSRRKWENVIVLIGLALERKSVSIIVLGDTCAYVLLVHLSSSETHSHVLAVSNMTLSWKQNIRDTVIFAVFGFEGQQLCSGLYIRKPCRARDPKSCEIWLDKARRGSLSGLITCVVCGVSSILTWIEATLLRRSPEREQFPSFLLGRATENTRLESLS